MTVRNLEFLFRPQSIAVIGASDREGSVGATVIRNALAGGFSGSIYPVNVHDAEVAGQRAYRDVASLPEAPDLAVIATPPATVPRLIEELGARGTRAAAVLTAGLAAASAGDGRSLTQAMLEAARPHLLRVLGPNCVGLLVPGLGLNASFAHASACAGISPSSPSQVGSRPQCSTGRARAASGSRISSRSATLPTSISATCWTISRATPRRARSCSTSNRCARRANSCPRRGWRRATCRCWR